MTQLTPTKHSRFSPSGSGRWMKCFGSQRLIESLNLPHRDNEYALEGTACHELAAAALEERIYDASIFMGKEFIKGYPVNQEMVNTTNDYVDYILGFEHPGSTLEVETYITMNDLAPDHGGTGDAQIWSQTELHIFDLKYGRGVPVEVIGNSQLMLYCAGKLRELVQAGKVEANKLERICLHIIQPRSPHPDGPCRSWDVSVDELREHWRNAKESIKIATSDNPTFEAGESQCRWCDAAPICKTLAEHNLSLAQKEFADLKAPKLDLIEANKMTPQQMSAIMQHSSTFTNWIKSIVSYAQNELERGRDVPDHKLVRGRANRGWGNGVGEQIVSTVKDLGFSEKDCFTEPKLKSPNQIELLVGKKNSDKFSSYIVKPQGKLTIAHVSDKRPAITKASDAADDFNDFK